MPVCLFHGVLSTKKSFVKSHHNLLTLNIAIANFHTSNEWLWEKQKLEDYLHCMLASIPELVEGTSS